MKATKAIDHERQRRGANLAADLRDAMSFPPLPPSPAEVGDLILQTREHVQALGWGNREQLYTASQVRALLSECAIMAAARERERWERALGAEMPDDFKCWHQNAASERPEVAAWVIRNLREREALAWSEGPNARLSGAPR